MKPTGLVKALSEASVRIEARNKAKSQLICQLHKTKELTKSRNPNRRVIDKEFDELHATIVRLVTHEKALIKRQEEDEGYVKNLKDYITKLEERLHKTEELLKQSLGHAQRIQQIDEAVSNLHRKVIRTFDLSENQAREKHISNKVRTDVKTSMLKRTIADLEKKYETLKKTEKDKDKLLLVRQKIDSLKAKIN